MSAGTSSSGGMSSSGAMESAATDGCAGERIGVVPSPADLLLLLDTSASMLDLVGDSDALGSPVSKWDVVRQALEAFVRAPGSNGTGIGLGYFPLGVPGVPLSCTSNDECGSGGPCSSSICVEAGVIDVPPSPPIAFVRAAEPPLYCSSDADCGTGQSCREMTGVCVYPPGALEDAPNGTFINVSADPTGPAIMPVCATAQDCAGLTGAVCEALGVCSAARLTCAQSVAPCPVGAGDCVPSPHTCLAQTNCEVGSYAAPAVPILDGVARNDAIVASLTAQTPVGLTPTGPALAGALQNAELWAAQHPERQLATVLITDGFPTACEPLEIDAIGALARAANIGERPVQTFVVGVFGTTDLGADGQARLDSLATAGGTGRAYVVNTAGDVSGTFSDALASIRSLAGSCGFVVDARLALDPERVQLELSGSDGAVRLLPRVDGASACSEGVDGWYYVRDGVGAPRRIVLCAESCASPEVTSQLQLRVGCL